MKEQVLEVTCDAPKGCSDFVRVPVPGYSIGLTRDPREVLAEMGWTQGKAEKDRDDPPDFCPVHKSLSGWDWQGDYPTSLVPSDSDELDSVVRTVFQ